MRSRVPHLAARIHGIPRPRDRQPPSAEGATTLPTPESPIAEAVKSPSATRSSFGRKEAVVPSADRKRKRKKSTSAREVVTLPWEKPAAFRGNLLPSPFFA
ncbi:hypothetical protein BHE74_00025586 [Ensete ventricosum]|nr:hypothetical protein BHE74_00025586 [Ensete ventricosum]RZR82671.1 hypothetical protein BHM03_00009139 [Ensete ventricosum]